MTTTQQPNGQCQAITEYEDGARIIVAARTADGTHLSDIASDGTGGMVIEPQLDTQAEVDAVVADYIAKAAQIGCVPMLPGCRWTD
ncbi:MAG TPA: hypothetical protein VHF90_05990 [Thermoleophilaceae bacterium]|nr:hypothetical protein [Thermoleophilaceae bacterium]